MFSTFDVSTSALVAQRVRLNAISSNLANLSTTRNETGAPEPYQPRFVIFQTDDDVTTPGGGSGVKVSSVEISDSAPLYRYQPGHPDAIQEGPRQGYVAYPNIDMTTEFVDALEASRAYEANLGVIEVTKDLGRQTLRILV
ncbi:MAG: flagellar basal body rod protein FlgC [Planctomycetes bacterium RBG_16_64_10]|nr:MAG: flagellar basal body rod protein FlgC [Planctomycetes bacterium RBG_16_64_10]